VGEENIRPKSIAREMFEQFRSFAEYVLDYDLERSEGLLLRHLNSVYKVLSQTVPDAVKTDEVLEMEQYLRTLLRGVDSSLATSGSGCATPSYRPLEGASSARGAETRPPGAEAALDVTRDTRRFTAAVRACVFLFLRAWWTRDQAGALAVLADRESGVSREGTAGEVVPAVGEWSPERLQALADAFRAERGTLRFDPEARNTRHTYVTPAEDGRTWRVQQMLVDSEMINDWVAEFELHLDRSRETGQPVMRLERIGPLG
jgi:hypothetical protein